MMTIWLPSTRSPPSLPESVPTRDDWCASALYSMPTKSRLSLSLRAQYVCRRIFFSHTFLFNLHTPLLTTSQAFVLNNLEQKQRNTLKLKDHSLVAVKMSGRGHYARYQERKQALLLEKKDGEASRQRPNGGADNALIKTLAEKFATLRPRNRARRGSLDTFQAASKSTPQLPNLLEAQNNQIQVRSSMHVTHSEY